MASRVGNGLIGGQAWTLKNLDVTTFRNGDPIPEVTSNATWASTTKPAWCYYNNDPTLGAIYGKIYNGHAIRDARGLAPVGWHIATTSEWLALADYYGGYSVAGPPLRQTGTTTWTAGGGTNLNGFNVLAGGFRYWSGGGFYNINSQTYFYTGTITGGVANIVAVTVASLIDWNTVLFNNCGGYVRLIKD